MALQSLKKKIILFSNILLFVFANNTVLRVLHAASSSTVVGFSKGIDGFDSTAIDTTIVATTTIVRGNRFFGEWKEKMDFGRCVTGMQPIKRTIPTCHIPINFGLITFQLNQCLLITTYSTKSTLCDHTID